MATVVATDTLTAPASMATRMVGPMATAAEVADTEVEAMAEALEATICQTSVLA